MNFPSPTALIYLPEVKRVKTLHQPYLTGIPDIDKYLVTEKPPPLMDYMIVDKDSLEWPPFWYQYLVDQLTKEEFQNVIEHYYPITYQEVLDQHTYAIAEESFSEHLRGGDKHCIENDACDFAIALIKKDLWIPQIVDYLKDEANPFLPDTRDELTQLIIRTTNDYSRKDFFMKTLNQTTLTGVQNIDKYLIQDYNLLDDVTELDYEMFFYEYMLKQIDYKTFKNFVETSYPYSYNDVILKHYEIYEDTDYQGRFYNDIFWFTYDLINNETWLPQIINDIRSLSSFFNMEEKIQLSLAVTDVTDEPELLDALSYYLELAKEENND